MGQGRDAAIGFLEENAETRTKLEAEVREKLFPAPVKKERVEEIPDEAQAEAPSEEPK